MKQLLIFATLVALFCGCEDIFEIDLTADKPTLIAPHDNATISSGEVNFAWEALDGATYYHLSVVSPSFESAKYIRVDTLIMADSLAGSFYKSKHKLEAGDYQWNVRAFNSAYKSDINIYTFKVEGDEI